MALLGFKPWDIKRLTRGQMAQYHQHIIAELEAAAARAPEAVSE